MMRCPSCGKPTLRRIDFEGGMRMECRNCPWGRQDQEGQPQTDPDAPPSWSVLIMRWALSSLIVAGPYFVIQQAIIEGSTRIGRDFQLPVTWYLLGTAAYLLVSLFIDPVPDHGDMGIAGTHYNDPTRVSDDINRNLMFLKIILAPGKFVIDTVWKSGEKVFYRPESQ